MKVSGIDVGHAAHRRSTGLCVLTIERGGFINWRCFNTGTEDSERRRDILGLLEGGPILRAAAIDGPLPPAQQRIDRYRLCEALLSRGHFQTRCKPGITNSKEGQALNEHAIRLAGIVQEVDRDLLNRANHVDRIQNLKIGEAFPNAFLGVLLEGGEADLIAKKLRRKKFDGYWEAAVENLLTLLEDLAAVRQPLSDGDRARLREELRNILDHDHRAAWVCALTALCLVRNKYVAAGDALDGYILLPPINRWADWAREALSRNVRAVQDDHLFAGREIQIVSNGRHLTPAEIRGNGE